MSNITFPKNSCSDHSVEISIPNKEVSLHKECGKMAGKTKVIPIKGKDLIFGLIQVHVKLLNLSQGMFSLNWDYTK